MSMKSCRHFRRLLSGLVRLARWWCCGLRICLVLNICLTLGIRQIAFLIMLLLAFWILSLYIGSNIHFWECLFVGWCGWGLCLREANKVQCFSFLNYVGFDCTLGWGQLEIWIGFFMWTCAILIIEEIDRVCKKCIIFLLKLLESSMLYRWYLLGCHLDSIVCNCLDSVIHKSLFVSCFVLWFDLFRLWWEFLLWSFVCWPVRLCHFSFYSRHNNYA